MDRRVIARPVHIQEGHAMKAQYINPFIESVHDLFNTMLGCEARRGDISLARSFSTGHEVIALIGLSGIVRGTVALAFPARTALHMVNRLLGVETIGVNDEVLDAVAELVNIVAGGAKAKLNGEADTPPISLSLPTVVQGKDYTVESPSYAKWLDVPFTSELGPFTLRVIFESDKRGTAA
jgi:chemotaxis protein CheX